MKKIIVITILSLSILSCVNKENSNSIDQLISSKNVKALQERKSILQADITKIEEALATLDVKKEEALVVVSTVKDTLFNHYLEIQGSVDTKENMLVQPEYSGLLTSLTVTAGQRVTKGQILGRVDDAGMSQQLANAENQYALAKTTYERQKNLWDKKIGSEMQYKLTRLSGIRLSGRSRPQRRWCCQLLPSRRTRPTAYLFFGASGGASAGPVG